MQYHGFFMTNTNFKLYIQLAIIQQIEKRTGSWSLYLWLFSADAYCCVLCAEV